MTAFIDEPLPGMPAMSPPAKVAAVHDESYVIKGNIDPPQYDFEANLLDLVLEYLQEFRDCRPEWPNSADDESYFEEKLSTFLTEMIDANFDIWSHDAPGASKESHLTWTTQFNYPDYNWSFTAEQIEGIHEYLVQHHLWAAENDATA